MSDADERNTSGRKPLSLGGGSTPSGTVRQSFPRGRQKAVVVEKKRKRPGAPGGKDAPASAGKDGAKPALSDKERARALLAAKAKQLGLSEEELLKRQAAIQRARAEQDAREEKKRAEEEDRTRRQADELRALEEQRQREEDERKAREEAERRRKAEAEAPARSEPEAPVEPDPAMPPEPSLKPQRKADKPRERGASDDAADMLSKMGGRIKEKKAEPAEKTGGGRGREGRRHAGKLTLQNIEEGDEGRQRSLASIRRAREREKMRRAQQGQGREKVSREVVVPEAITVQDLAQRMAERAADVVKYLMTQGQMVRANDVIDADTAELIVEEFGHTVKRVSESDVELGFISAEDDDGAKKPRPPVVTVMGHVDHGKTSLLDALRQTDVAAGEAGGITQHIGAYQVQLKTGDRITFLDTPGHAAFSSMRARGAQATDIVILVVAADDGVMPQTIEAIKHAKAAGVPIIVAVNKIDKPDATPDKVLQELLQHEVFVESMGGDVQSVNVSATKKTGLDELTEAITLQSELLELKANPDRSAEGVVIESQIDKGRGPVATVLVKRGTLKRGDIVVAGAQWGKVRALVNERGQQMKDAGPSLPAEILGLDGAPEPGEVFAVVETEARARELVAYRQRMVRDRSAAARTGMGASLEQMMARLQQAEVSEMPMLVKSDVQGSAEAIGGAMDKLGNEEVRARVIHSAPGGVSESDVLLARASGAPIFAFNVRANKQARELAEREGVEIRYYSVIYDLIDDVKATLEGMLAPEKRETFIGYAEILEVFSITKVGKVAGCRVTEGVVKRGCGVRLLRDDTVLHEGKLSTLKRFKDEVPEVRAGTECGMAFEKYEDIQVGDQIECFQVEEVKRSL
ncbi:translation initiation factor IF-2 [Alkalicaulis satelles]|uniref:Translation initiation factor IF-2 n=1 Tax=Alkalicaulis satelles TaxID=2609175 RepID=A0A5M6ZFG5_9PROT|nr:translation initiation factor IF-2 [Alkalicaulis satelles]KAA5803486.1 translation initiation factor IF-2 [Alkalicaulis satelles]